MAGGPVEPPPDYPAAYVKCTVCGVLAGVACRVRSGRIVSGRPNGVDFTSPIPHVSRKRRKGR